MYVYMYTHEHSHRNRYIIYYICYISGHLLLSYVYIKYIGRYLCIFQNWDLECILFYKRIVSVFQQIHILPQVHKVLFQSRFGSQFSVLQQNHNNISNECRESKNIVNIWYLKNKKTQLKLYIYFNFYGQIVQSEIAILIITLTTKTKLTSFYLILFCYLFDPLKCDKMFGKSIEAVAHFSLTYILLLILYVCIYTTASSSSFLDVI